MLKGHWPGLLESLALRSYKSWKITDAENIKTVEFLTAVGKNDYMHILGRSARAGFPRREKM